MVPGRLFLLLVAVDVDFFSHCTLCLLLFQRERLYHTYLMNFMVLTKLFYILFVSSIIISTRYARTFLWEINKSLYRGGTVRYTTDRYSEAKGVWPKFSRVIAIKSLFLDHTFFYISRFLGISFLAQNEQWYMKVNCPIPMLFCHPFCLPVLIFVQKYTAFFYFCFLYVYVLLLPMNNNNNKNNKIKGT